MGPWAALPAWMLDKAAAPRGSGSWENWGGKASWGSRGWQESEPESGKGATTWDGDGWKDLLDRFVKA